MHKIIFLLALLMASPALAQLNPSPNDPQAPVTIPRFSGTLKDFSTIEFLCTSEASGDYVSTGICAAAEGAVRDYAGDLRMSVVPSAGRNKDDSFIIYIRVTSAGTAPRGMAVTIEASRYMEAAIDKNARNSDPASSPRRGKLVFWQETATGVGQGDRLEMQLRRRVQSLVRLLFSQISDGKI